MTDQQSADRPGLLEDYGSAHGRIVAALERYPREMWQWRPGAGNWSIQEILLHLVDSEPGAYFEARTIVAEPGVKVAWMDQEKWAAALDYLNQDPLDALEVFRWVRKTTYDLLKRLPAAAWENGVIGPSGRDYTLDGWLRVYTRHVPAHLEQMEAVHEAWLASRA